MAIRFDFANIKTEDKAYLRGLHATLVIAPREMSEQRQKSLVKEVLANGNVVFGVAAEEYVDGFSGQPQFQTTPVEYIQRLALDIETAKLPHGMCVVRYHQEDVDDVIRAVRPNSVVVVRGSYLYPFHRSATFELMTKRGIPFRYVSPFVDEAEAKEYLAEHGFMTLEVTSKLRENDELRTEADVFAVVDAVAKQSYDYSFQTGAVLAEATENNGFKILDAACNEVVPYQTYALHFGNSREEHQSAHQGDAVHYDTIHAEMNLLVRAMQRGVTFTGKSLFINMLPCPNCARTLVKTGLQEVVYRRVHSDGYAVDLFEKSGIKTRRV